MKKIILGSLIALALVAFFVPSEYINLAKFLRYAKLSQGCLTNEEERKMKTKSVSRDEQESIARRNFSCIQSKQNFIERALIPVPDEWLSTPSGRM